MIRSFGDSRYAAVRRQWDPQRRSHRFVVASCDTLTRDMRREHDWYVAGWKIHLSIYPGDYASALPALRLFEDRLAAKGLVYKYAASRRMYEAFMGDVKGKFATIYCQSAADVPPVIYLVNQLFTQEGITPVSRAIVDSLPGLRHELPLIDGFGFVRYGAFCYTKGLLDLSDPERAPMRDSRHRPYPRFNDPSRLEGEMDAFRGLIVASPQG